MAKFKLSLLTIIADESRNYAKCLQSMISEFDSEIERNNLRDGAYTKNTSQKSFCYSYNEQLKIQKNNQKELTFSMNKMTIHNDGWEENPFVQNITVGSQLALVDKYENTILFSVKSINHTFKEQNTVYQYTCQDSFSFQLSRQNAGYTIENDPNSEDFIGSQPVDWWVNNKIVPECYISYTYLAMNQGLYVGYDNKLHTYYANQRLYNIKKILKQPQTAKDYYEAISFSGSGTANSLLISLGEQLGLSLNTCEAIGDQGILLKYFWFEPSKNEQPSGLYLSPYTDIQNFSLQHTGNSLTTVLNVSGGEVDGELVTLLPTITPFFNKYFQSQEWRAGDYKPGMFTRLCYGKSENLSKTQHNFINDNVKSYVNTTSEWNTATGVTAEDKKLSLLNSNLKVSGTTKPKACIMPVFKNPSSSDTSSTNISTSLCDIYIPLTNTTSILLPTSTDNFYTYKLSSFYSKYAFSNEEGNSYILTKNNKNENVLLTPQSYSWNLSLIEPQVSKIYFVSPFITKSDIQAKVKDGVYYPYASIGINNSGNNIWSSTKELHFKDNTTWKDEDWLEVEIYSYKNEDRVENAKLQIPENYTKHIKQRWTNKSSSPKIDISSLRDGTTSFEVYISSNRPDAFDFITWGYINSFGEFVEYTNNKEGFYRVEDVRDCYLWVSGVDRNFAKPGKHLTPSFLTPRIGSIEELLQNNQGISVPIQAPLLLQKGDRIVNKSGKRCFLLGKKQTYSNGETKPDLLWETMYMPANQSMALSTIEWSYFYLLEEKDNEVELEHSRDSDLLSFGEYITQTKVSIKDDISWQQAIFPYRQIKTGELTGNHILLRYTKNNSNPAQVIYLESNKTYTINYDAYATPYAIKILTSNKDEAKSKISFWYDIETEEPDAWATISIQTGLPGPTYNSIIQSNSEFILNTAKCSVEDQVYGQIKTIDEYYSEDVTQISFNKSSATIKKGKNHNFSIMLISNNENLELKDLFSIKTKFGSITYNVWPAIVSNLTRYRETSFNMVVSGSDAQRRIFELHSLLLDIPSDQNTGYRLYTKDPTKLQITSLRRRESGEAQWTSSFYLNKDQIDINDEGATNAVISCSLIVSLLDPQAKKEDILTYGGGFTNELLARLHKIPGTNTYTFAVNNTSDLLFGNSWKFYSMQSAENLIHNLYTNNAFVLKENLRILIKSSNSYDYTWVVYNNNYDLIDCGSSQSKLWLTTETKKLDSNYRVSATGENYQCIDINSILNRTSGQYCSVIFKKTEDYEQPLLGSNCWSHSLFMLDGDQVIPAFCLYGLGREPDMLSGQLCQAYFNSETVVNAKEEIPLVALNKPQLTYIKIRAPYNTATALSKIQDYDFYLQWSRTATAEDLQFAQIADQCPWLENRLVDFKYFYERNILTKKEFEDITNLFNNTLRVLNGRLLAASHQYYSALHNKTKTISNFTNNLDLLGANFSAEVLTPYQKGSSSFDTTQFKQSYKQLFPTTPYGYPLLDYDATFSDYVNKYFNAEQRFLKNIYNFKSYFEEPVSFYPKGGGLYNNTIELLNNKFVSTDQKSFVQVSFPSANMSKLTTSYSNYIQDPLDSRWGRCFDNVYQKTNNGFQLITPVDAAYVENNKDKIKTLKHYEEGFAACTSNEQYNTARKYYRKDWKFVGSIKDQNYLYDNSVELIDEIGNRFKPYKTNEGLFYKQIGIITGGEAGTSTILLEPGHESYSVTAVYVEVSKSDIEKNYLAKVIKTPSLKKSSSLWYWKNTEPYVQVLTGNNRWLTPDELSVELPVYFKRKLFSKNPRSDEYTDTITNKLISDVETDFSGNDARDLYIRYFPIQELYFYDNSISFIDNQPSVLNKAGKTFKEWKDLYEKEMTTLEEQPHLYKTYQRVGFVNEDNYKQYFWRTYTTAATGPGLEYDLTALKSTTNVSELKDKETYLETQSNLLTLANEVYQFEDSAFGNIGYPSTTISGDYVYYWNKLGYKEGYSGTDDDYNIKKQIFVQNTAGHRLYRVYQNVIVDGLHTGYLKTNSSGQVVTETAVSNNRIHYYNYAGNLLHTYHSINKKAGSTYIHPYSSFNKVKNQYYYNGKWYRPKKLTDLVNRNDSYKILIQPEKYINLTNINNETAEASCVIKFSLDNTINAIQFYPLSWVLSKCDFSDLEWGNQQTLTLENALTKAGLASQAVSDTSYKLSLTGGASTSTHVNQFDAYVYHEEDYLAMDILNTYNTTKDNWYQQFLSDNYTIYDSATDLKVDFTSEPSFLSGYYSNTGGDSSLTEVEEFNINAEYYELKNGFYDPIYTIEQLKNRDDIYYLNNVTIVEETIDAPTEWKQDVNVIYGKTITQKHLVFTEPENVNRQLKQYDKVTIDFTEDEQPKQSTWIVQSATQAVRTGPITYNLIWAEGDIIDTTSLELSLNGIDIDVTYQLSSLDVMSTEDYTHNTQNVCFDYNRDYITVTYQDQEYQFAYSWERKEIFNFDLMSNGMFWLNFHNSLEYSTLFQQAALIEMKLTEYWSQAYNASQFCQYFLPASWQPTSNNEANVFAGEILKVINEPSSLRISTVNQKQDGTVERDYSNLSSVTLASTYIPNVEVLNQDNAEYYRYSLKFYSNTGDLLNATISSDAISEDLQQNCFYSLESCAQQNAALRDLINTLKINPGQWLAVQSGKQTYYRHIDGGTTWKQLAYRLLNEQLEYFGGWYQMAVYALSVPFYTPQNVNQYHQLQKEHNDIWKKIYITYPHVLLEKDYKNTTALDSESLLKTATYAFNDYKDIERQYSITLLDVNSIKGYEGQELRIGDSIALKYTDYHNDVGEIQDGLKQLLFITDLSYNLRQDTDISVTVNTIKYQDKLIQRLAKLIR